MSRDALLLPTKRAHLKIFQLTEVQQTISLVVEATRDYLKVIQIIHYIYYDRDLRVYFLF